MNRREFMKTASLAAGGAVLPSAARGRNKSKLKNPNIVFVFADQLRADVLGYHVPRLV